MWNPAWLLPCRRRCYGRAAPVPCRAGDRPCPRSDPRPGPCWCWPWPVPFPPPMPRRTRPWPSTCLPKRRLCEAEAGALWGRSLCGPVMLVDPADAGVVASHADAGGVLVRLGAVYTGTLPADSVLSHTATAWSGTRWTQLLWPVPQEPNMLRTALVHELFHRIQPELGLDRGEAGNRHLDTFQGRYLLQLEWRALARALMAEDPAQRGDHAASALAFRAERRRLSPEAAPGATAPGTPERLAEYTGVRAGLAFAEQPR